MGAEEKKLYPEREAGQTETCQTDVRLHLFPTIQADRPNNASVCRFHEDNFKRIQYDKKIGTDRKISPDSSKSDLGADKNLSSVGQFNQQIYQEGYCKGLAKGKSEGEKTGVALASRKIEPLINSLQTALMQLKNLRQETCRHIELQLVDLALAIARQVVCREIQMDKEVVICVAREALGKVADAASINIKMSPSDLEFINQTKYQLSDLVDKIDNITIEAEEGIQSGGCIIETNLGEIDARIEKQLQAVEESFRSALQCSEK